MYICIHCSTETELADEEFDREKVIAYLSSVGQVMKASKAVFILPISSSLALEDHLTCPEIWGHGRGIQLLSVYYLLPPRHVHKINVLGYSS